MAAAFTPYIHFDGNAAEAMAAYGEIFGTTPDIMTFGQSGHPDEAIADQVMHSSLYVGPGLHLMASDTPDEMGEGFRGTGNIDIAVSSDGGDSANDPKLTGWWEGLAEGATILQPLADAPWGGKFGMLVDRFGVRWMFNITALRG